ncbi:UDP-galactopyranose mutase [Treponema zioleckii]|uniref:UDP-galactopyranose mutase n=1 Tax=Treponema zioleckii TaxID=331680 RepID=UPI00168A837E|nr:UDP-galactopyranose mutase [Treponema zioleckii]
MFDSFFDASTITRKCKLSGAEPFYPIVYPINDEKNSLLYKKYGALAAQYKNVILGGRLAEYKYSDMDDVIEKAARTFQSLNF